MRARLGTWYSRGIARCVRGIIARVPSVAPDDHRLFFTFDDGPTPEGTGPLLDVLAKHEVPAVFFLLGDNAARHPGLVRDILAAGHELGNHSATHLDAWKAPQEEMLDELERTTRVLEDLSGTRPAWLRTPFGRVTKPVVKWSRQNRQPLVLWDLMPPDFEPHRTPASVSRVLLRSVRSGSIIVLHDNAKAHGITPAVLAETLPRLRDAGWQFGRLSETEFARPASGDDATRFEHDGRAA